MEDDNSIRQQVTKYICSLPNQKRTDVKAMCKDLGISDAYYKANKQYLYNLISDAKLNYQNRQGLKSLNFHNWRGFLYATKSLDRVEAVKVGWVPTKAKNHMLVFKNDLGRLQWHETGRINVWIKKPVSDGKKLQLLSDAFFRNGLIYDIHVFQQWSRTLKLKGVHCTVDTGEKLPYLKVDAFQKTNGTILLLGDRSHPTSAELIVNYPDWAERNEAMAESMKCMLATVMTGFTQQAKQVSDMFSVMNGLGQSKPLSEVKGIYQ